MKNHGATKDNWLTLDLILGLGADLLPVVSNPNATISAKSTMKALGKTPSLYNRDRNAVGIAKWTDKFSTSAEIEKWSKEPDYGICIQTRRVRALDVDVTDATASATIKKFILDRYPASLSVPAATVRSF